MKKFFTVLLILAVGTTTFALEGRYGLDFSWGLNFGFQNMTIQDTKAELQRIDLSLPLVRVSSYNHFLWEDTLGVFATASISGGLQFGDTITVSEKEIKSEGIAGFSDAFAGIEFMVGPSMLFEAGDDMIVQVGLGFHYLYEKSLVEGLMEFSGVGDPEISLHSFGVALTPQARLTPDDPMSFIFGCDITIDFGRVPNDVPFFADEIPGDLISGDDIDTYVRVGLNPYLGFGINF